MLSPLTGPGWNAFRCAQIFYVITPHRF